MKPQERVIGAMERLRQKGQLNASGWDIAKEDIDFYHRKIGMGFGTLYLALDRLVENGQLVRYTNEKRDRTVYTLVQPRSLPSERHETGGAMAV